MVESKNTYKMRMELMDDLNKARQKTQHTILFKRFKINKNWKEYVK